MFLYKPPELFPAPLWNRARVMARVCLRPRQLLLNGLASSISPWILGNVQVLPPKGGPLLYNSQCYRYKGTYICGLMPPPSPRLEAQQSLFTWKASMIIMGTRHVTSSDSAVPAHVLTNRCTGKNTHRFRGLSWAARRALRSIISIPRGACWCQSGPPGFPWRPPLLPVCDSWCHMCSTQRCGLRDAHDLHLCMRCERRPVTDPAPVGGGDPWAEKDEEKA